MSDIDNNLKSDIANFNRSLVVLNAYVCVYMCVWVYWLFMHVCIYVNIYVCMYVDKLQLNVKIFSWNRRHKSTYRHVKNQRRIFLYKIHRENRKWFFLNTIRAPPSEVVLICMRKKIIVRLTLLVTDVSGSLSWSFFISIWKGNAFAVTPPLPAGFTTCEWERFEYSSRTAALLWRSRTAESVFVTPSRFIQRPSLEFLTLQRRTRNTSPHPWIFPIPYSSVAPVGTFRQFSEVVDNGMSTSYVLTNRIYVSSERLISWHHEMFTRRLPFIKYGCQSSNSLYPINQKLALQRN